MRKKAALTLAYCILFLIIFRFASAQGLTVRTGASIVMNSSSRLVINNGGFNNAGTFTAGNGTVIFSGTSNATITSIGGTSTISFYNLAINKPAGNARITRNISVSNTVNIQLGDLDLNGFDLDLGASGAVTGETATSSITGASGGNVLRTVTLNAPVAANPGNVGIEITSAANLGATTIRRGHQQPVGGTGNGITRYYDIVPANNTGLNASIRFYYFDDELAGITESDLKLWSSPDGGVTWSVLNKDAQDLSLNYVSATGVNTLNRLTLGNDMSTLPVSLLYFKGQSVNDIIKLNWATAGETNSDYFDVEKSGDGRQFTAFAKLAAMGNTGSVTNYTTEDTNPFPGTSYYRLKQVDRDNKFTHSNIVTISRKAGNGLISVYPNPSTGPITVKFHSSEAVNTLLRITDYKGNVVRQQPIPARKGMNELVYDISALAAGTYNIELQGTGHKAMTIIKY